MLQSWRPAFGWSGNRPTKPARDLPRSREIWARNRSASHSVAIGATERDRAQAKINHQHGNAMRHNNNGLSELCDCSRCRGPGRAEGDRTRMVADPRIGRKALLTNAVRTGKEAVQFSGLQGSKTFSSQELAPGGLAGCSGEGGRILYGEDRQPGWVGIQSSITLSRSPPVDPA